MGTYPAGRPNPSRLFIFTLETSGQLLQLVSQQHHEEQMRAVVVVMLLVLLVLLVVMRVERAGLPGPHGQRSFTAESAAEVSDARHESLSLSLSHTKGANQRMSSGDQVGGDPGS